MTIVLVMEHNRVETGGKEDGRTSYPQSQHISLAILGGIQEFQEKRNWLPDYQDDLDKRVRILYNGLVVFIFETLCSPTWPGIHIVAPQPTEQLGL